MVESRLAIWGTFDVANFGDLLFPRIFEHEVRRRLPEATVRSFSPLGYLHPVPLDGGFVAEPLGERTDERLAELARDLDFVAIGGGEIIHPHDEYYGHWYGAEGEETERLRPSEFFVEGLGQDLEPATPVTWHSVGVPFDLDGEFAERVRQASARRAYLSVRDEHSRSRLHDAGVETEIAVVPDSALLMDRLFATDVLERRRDYLRAIGSFPAEGKPLVVQGSAGLLPHVDAIGRALSEQVSTGEAVPILLLETGPCHGDAEFAAALAPYLPPERIYRTGECLVVEDLVAAIAGSRGFVGISLHGSITAFVYGLPFAVLNLLGYSKLDGFATSAGSNATLISSSSDLRDALARVLSGKHTRGDLEPLAARVDTHFDRIAEEAERAARARRSDASDGRWSPQATRALAEAEQRNTVLREAFDARGRGLVRERLRLVRVLAQPEHSHDVQALRDELTETRAGLDAAESQIQALREDLAQTRAELDAAESELSRVRATKVFRYSAPLRGAWGRLRARR